jgi:hypothetical protein
LFLYFYLYRKSMSVPSTFPKDLVAFQRLISTKRIFDSTAYYMMYPRTTISGRRPFEESEYWGSLARVFTFLKYLGSVPEFQDFVLNIRKI